MTKTESNTVPVCFVVNGDSMSPLFNGGDHIIIDPDVEPMPDDFVVAKVGDRGVTFKKYRPRRARIKGERVFDLVPVNADYATIRSDSINCQIVGTVIQH